MSQAATLNSFLRKVASGALPISYVFSEIERYELIFSNS